MKGADVGIERVTTLSDACAEAVRAARKREGMTRAELAERAQAAGAGPVFTAAVVGYIETGRRDAAGRRRREVSLDELVHLAYALDTTPLALLGVDAATLGGDEPAPCPRCRDQADRGGVAAAVSADLDRLGEMEGVEPGLAATALALADAIDADGVEEGRQLAALAKELRATLAALQESVRARSAVDDEDEGDFGGLGEPD